MKKFFLLFTFLFALFTTRAQIVQNGSTLYGNEWIDYDQSYYKVTVSATGLYRITYQDLLEAGVFDENEVPEGANFQLYYRGEEQPIYVSETAVFQSGDYIEFFGQRNDGWLDQFLYEKPEYQLNPTYSMYTEVSSYFLTWRSDADNMRMTNEENTLNNVPAATPYCWAEYKLNYSETYEEGRLFGSNSESISCAYDLGEGYAKRTFKAVQQFSLTTPYVYTNGPNAQLSARIYARQGVHNYDWQLNEISFEQERAIGWSVKTMQATLNSATLKTNNLLKIEGLSEATDRFQMVEANIRYPRTFNFAERKNILFELPANSEGHYIEIQNFDAAESTPILYDFVHQKRYTLIAEDNLLKVFLPASQNSYRLYLTSEAQIQQPSTIRSRTFEEYDFENATYDYLLLSHNKLIDDENRYLQQYADYRASAAGGGFQPLVVDVTQLYDQFGYGVARHEVGIKNFLRLAHENWGSDYLFIVGKGIDRHKMRRRTFNADFDLVPSYGYPNADYLFTTFEDTSVPSMAVGRIAAYTSDQVRIYLKKIQEHEAVFSTAEQTLEDKEWTKRVLHFSGGDENIQAYIRNTLGNLKQMLDTSLYGSNAIVFAKGSSETVSDVPAQVGNYINDGTAMLTFFGHSAPSTLDFNLGEAREYNNKGRYPFFYAIGCNTNRVFDVGNTLSEEWVLIEDKGAIGFFGSTWTTQLANLANYALVFYDNLGKDNYGERLGQVVKATMADFGQDGSFAAEQTKQVLMLHGDPAIQLYSYEKADYLVNAQESKVEPNILDLQQGTFQAQLKLHNIGKHIEDSLIVLIEHQLADGSWRTLSTLETNAPDFEKDVTVNLFIEDDATVATGRNQLRITLDPDNTIEEGPQGAENNNVQLLTFFVARSDVQPIFPEDMSIVSTEDVRLQASTTDAFSKMTTYFVELDTTMNFDSPTKVATSITQIGGVISWQPDVEWQNDKVYYWRIGLDNSVTGTEEVNWRVRSFTYLKEGMTEGWNQGHHFQLEQNDYENAQYLNRQVQFSERTKAVRMINSTSGSGLLEAEMALFQDGFRSGINNFSCSNNQFPNGRLNLVIQNDNTLGAYSNIQPAPNCWNNFSWYMFNPNSVADREKLTEVLTNMRPGDYGIFYTTQLRPQFGYAADEWAADSLIYGTNIFQAFESRTNPQLLRRVADQQNPYILIFQADNPDFVVGEALAENRNEIIEVESVFRGKQSIGSFYSVPIGPAQRWEQLQWQTETRESSDSVYIRVFAMTDAEGSERILIDSTYEAALDLSYVDATEFPYLQLEYVAKDEVNRTPAQLDYWRVGFEARPDVALAPNLNFKWHADELEEGERFSMTTAVVNPTLTDMDSLRVSYTIVNDINEQTTYWEKYAPIPAQSTADINLELSTLELNGIQQLLIEVNPENEPIEQYIFNNIGVREFRVLPDRRNPLLDVTFDGTRISNGAIVAAQPVIEIQLRDENKYLALDDESVLEVGILYPSGELKAFNYEPNVLEFSPAQLGSNAENRAVALFTPTFTESGNYQLQVLARDRSGNVAGNFVYTVDFEVDFEEYISPVEAYPNPFSTSTQFVFELKGEALPENMYIQLFATDGKLVKTIQQTEMNNLRVGSNRITVDWDGTDSFGRRLADGVYFYRVWVVPSSRQSPAIEINSGTVVRAQ